MTSDEARALKRGDRVIFSDPAFGECFPPTRGNVAWVIKAEPGICTDEVGIHWEGQSAVKHNPATDFDYIRKSSAAT